ncbi:unnamed protein product [Choristocarpus tenellus]
MSSDRSELFSGRAGEKRDEPRQSSRRQPAPARKTRTTGSTLQSRGGTKMSVGVSATRREAQMKEAEQHQKAGNKYLQKTMTRWTPNYFSAAPLFEKAASCYHGAGQDSMAVSMFVTAAECHEAESVSAFPSAAKNYKEAAVIESRAGRDKESAELYILCANSWHHANEGGRAADYLGCAAKAMEGIDEDVAAEHYLKAAAVMVPDGCDTTYDFVRVIGGTNVLSQAINFLASTGKLKECMEVVGRYEILAEAEGMDPTLAQLYLSSCVLILSTGDFVRADGAFSEVHLQNTAYLHSKECKAEEDFLTAFKNYDALALKKVQDDRTLLRLSTPIIRLAKALSIPGEEEDIIPAPRNPASSVGDVQTRLDAIKGKYGVAPPPAPPHTSNKVPDCAPPGSMSVPGPSQAQYYPEVEPVVRTTQEGDDMATLKSGLFGPGTCTQSETGNICGMGPEKPSALVPDEPAGDSLGVVDLGLDDLELSLGAGGLRGVGHQDSDDLGAAIEAARREAEALDIGGEGHVDHTPHHSETGGTYNENYDEDEIDLT